MEIDLSRLTSRELVVEGDVRLPADPPDAPGSLADEGVRLPETVRLDATVRKVGAVVVVVGRVTGRVEIACCRCLAPVEHRVDVDFESRYLEASAAPAAPASGARRAGAAAGPTDDVDDGVRLQADDLDVAFLPAGTTHLDVAEVAREQVVLDLPHRVTCRPDCAGLCPGCGADRNEGPCACDREGHEAVDPRLLVLADLRRRLKGS